MSKYEGLTEFLRSQQFATVAMTFADVEQRIGARLPKSAVFYRMWWSNNTSNHVHAKAWVDAGFQTEQVDMERKKVVFRRVKTAQEKNNPGPFPPGLSESRRMFKTEESAEKRSRRSPLFGALKGTFSIEPGWDLTQPALDADELAELDANTERTADLIDEGMSGKRK